MKSEFNLTYKNHYIFFGVNGTTYDESLQIFYKNGTRNNIYYYQLMNHYNFLGETSAF